MDRPLLHYRYEKHYDRTTVLYLHGFMGSGDDWQYAVERIGSSFSHLMVDLPGHGKSEDMDAYPPSVYSMPGCAAEILRLLDSLKIARCHVVGYSMGGRLALYLAIHHGERLGRFVIESGSPGLKTQAERDERRRRDEDLADSLRVRSFDDFLKFWYSQPLFSTMDQSSDAFASMLKRRNTNNPKALAMSLEQMGTGVQPSLWAELPKIKNPMLFVAGEKDHKFNQLAAAMAYLCPAAELAIIASAGHNVHFEQTREYASQVRTFLSER